MPPPATRNQGKTSFIKEYLHDHKQATAPQVNEAWAKSGEGGTISASLVNKVRADLGLTGNIRGRRGPGKKGLVARTREVAAVDAGAEIAPEPLFKTTARGRGAKQGRLNELEADFDRLIFKVMSVSGLSDVEDALRGARRSLYKAMG